jgi:hypothetical protein
MQPNYAWAIALVDCVCKHFPKHAGQKPAATHKVKKFLWIGKPTKRKDIPLNVRVG